MIKGTQGAEGRKRFVWCAVLLAVLVASAAHAGEWEGKQIAALPVARVYDPVVETASMGSSATRETINMQRAKEIEMLEQVLAHPDSGKQTRADALSQKTDIVRRMEFEAQAQACIENLGIKNSTVLCGAQNMTVFVPFEYASDEKMRTAMIDAVSTITGIGAESVKIILAKNE